MMNMPWTKDEVHYYRGYTIIVDPGEHDEGIFLIYDMGMEHLTNCLSMKDAEAVIDGWHNPT